MYGPAFITAGSLFLALSSHAWIGCILVTVGLSLFSIRIYTVATCKQSYDLVPRWSQI